jgi:CheY-like chemotaxis protein
MKRSYTILYVDDDADDLALISEAFEKFTDHLTVIHAGNGMEGLSLLERMNKEHKLPCLLIIDINMPIMDGKEMLRKLREEVPFKELPVIMFSTSDSSRDRQFAENYEADFLSKPSTYNELKALVGHFVSKCRFEVEKTA